MYSADKRLESLCSFIYNIKDDRKSMDLSSTRENMRKLEAIFNEPTLEDFWKS